MKEKLRAKTYGDFYILRFKAFMKNTGTRFNPTLVPDFNKDDERDNGFKKIHCVLKHSVHFEHYNKVKQKAIDLFGTYKHCDFVHIYKCSGDIILTEGGDDFENYLTEHLILMTTIRRNETKYAEVG